MLKPSWATHPVTPPFLRPFHKADKATIRDCGYQCGTQLQPAKESFWIKASDDPVAAFTGVLALFTLGLWIFTALMWLATRRAVNDAADNSDAQGKLTRASIAEAAKAAVAMERVATAAHHANEITSDTTERSIAAAVRAAEASEKSAAFAEKALNKLEGAIIRPHHITFLIDPEGHIKFGFRNFGRSAAKVSNVSAIVRVSLANIPITIIADRSFPIMFEETIAEKEISEILTITDNILRQYSLNIVNAVHDLHLQISYTWESLLDHSEIRMERYIWSPKRKRFLQGLQLWDDSERFPPGQTRRP